MTPARERWCGLLESAGGARDHVDAGDDLRAGFAGIGRHREQNVVLEDVPVLECARGGRGAKDRIHDGCEVVDRVERPFDGEADVLDRGRARLNFVER